MKYITREIDGYWAGIGHKLYNWLIGYAGSKVLDINYAYMPFPDKSDDDLHEHVNWGEFFSLGRGEVHVSDLINDGYKMVNLPFFNVDDKNGLKSMKSYVRDYPSDNIIFNINKDNVWFSPQSKFRLDLRLKYRTSPFRKIMKPSYSNSYTNISIHVRRGDIVKGFGQYDETRNNDILYYLNIIENLNNIKFKKPVMFHLYSQNNIEDLNLFKKYNINFYINTDVRQMFTDFVASEIMVCSDSGLSFQMGYVSDNVVLILYKHKIIDNWVKTYEDGSIDMYEFNKKVEFKKII